MVKFLQVVCCTIGLIVTFNEHIQIHGLSGAHCPGNEECQCSDLTRCVDCKSENTCSWDLVQKKCTNKSFWDLHFGTTSGDRSCPCQKCEDWYNSEVSDTAWLDEVNAMFPCPCRVTLETFGLGLVPVGQPASDWSSDLACSSYGVPFCSRFHPGAYGCIRSSRNTPSGARQQCCYDSDGDVLPADDPGAGTPDRAGSYSEHQAQDVTPFGWCCQQCEEESGSCQKYKNVRKGNYSHCEK